MRKTVTWCKLDKHTARDMRHFALSSAIAVLGLHPALAWAQHCQRVDVPSATVSDWNASIQWERAVFRNSRLEGEFVGVTSELGRKWRDFGLGVRVPYYWLSRNGASDHGLGDVVVDVAWRPIEQATFSGGLFLALSLPSGEPQQELGMGHPMLAVGGDGALDLGTPRVRLLARAGYARALYFSAGGSHAQHAGGLTPVVAPMNMSEVAGQLALNATPLSWFAATITSYGATPVAGAGVARLVAAAGPTLRAEPLALTLLLHAPLLSDVFKYKLSLMLQGAF